MQNRLRLSVVFFVPLVVALLNPMHPIVQFPVYDGILRDL
jgi:hypothetical protein